MARSKFRVRSVTLAVVAAVLLIVAPALALTPIPPPGPQNSSTGLEGSITVPPPSRAPTITVPGSGQSFTSTPITVAGLCSAQTVKMFSNNVFVGAANCAGGSYTLKIDLFSGQNDLIARQYDQLDQQSPDSNTVTVTFNSAQFAQFGTRVTLTSSYARRGADPGQTLTWPIALSGGQGPYAISVDWGDGKPAELLSQSSIGTFNVNHVYDASGTYAVIVQATDANGTEAFLQLVGVANGQAAATANTSSNTPTIITKTNVLWWPMIVLIALVLLAFWIGRKQQLAAIRHSLEKSRGEQ